MNDLREYRYVASSLRRRVDEMTSEIQAKAIKCSQLEDQARHERTQVDKLISEMDAMRLLATDLEKLFWEMERK